MKICPICGTGVACWKIFCWNCDHKFTEDEKTTKSKEEKVDDLVSASRKVLKKFGTYDNGKMLDRSELADLYQAIAEVEK